MTRASRTVDPARVRVGRQVRDLRLSLGISQDVLAASINLSQAQLSEVERGRASLTAERFLALLRLLETTPEAFACEPPSRASALQNALVALGAAHLQVSDRVGDPALRHVSDVVRETLVDGSPRLVTALAPVLVLHPGVRLPALFASLYDLGFERRLGWVIQSTLEAVAALAGEGGPESKRWSRAAESIEIPLRMFLDTVAGRERPPVEFPDVLDATIRTAKTLERVGGEASPVARQWGIVTAIRSEDFVDALRLSGAVAGVSGRHKISCD